MLGTCRSSSMMLSLLHSSQRSDLPALLTLIEHLTIQKRRGRQAVQGPNQAYYWSLPQHSHPARLRIGKERHGRGVEGKDEGWGRETFRPS